MRVIATGIAGFIGYHLTKRLLREGVEVVGVDNINDYYDVELKYARLAELGFDRAHIEEKRLIRSAEYPALQLFKCDIAEREAIEQLFKEQRPDVVINLAAQAGVRYSLEQPFAYTHSNVEGFLSILEGCRRAEVKRLIYASSSSVYGSNSKVPFSEEDTVEQPQSLYAATKRSNELMASCYEQLYSIECIGLRFFTVYGPWGRPDMAPMLFADAITHHRAIKVFGEGELWRDFTYIDDVVEGVWKIVAGDKPAPHRLYNIGHSEPVKLTEFISTLEQTIGKEAKKEYLPQQAGDVERTWADCSRLEQDFAYHPTTSLSQGIAEFVKWYKEYYKA
ncbi:MAG: GDP-mannose 4,6-dehydratase [Alistipes sp.]|nr:GDP-mannose 4,6-dehydratase [Alistipes sp.]